MQTEEVQYNTERFDNQQDATSVSHKEANQKAAQASVISGDGTGATYDTTYNELTITGSSPTLDESVQQASQYDMQGTVSQILLNNDTATGLSLAQAYVSRQSTPGELVKDTTMLNDKYSEMFGQQAKIEELTTQALRAYQNKISEQEDSETGQDFLKSIIPFFDAAALQEMSGSAPGLGAIFTGEKHDRLRAEFQALGQDEKIAYIQDVIKKADTKNMWIGTPLSQMEAVSNTLEGQNRFDYWMNNIGSVADFISLGAVPKALKAMGKFGEVLSNTVEPASVISTTKHSNPVMSRALATQAIEGDAKLAEKVSGTTKEGVFMSTDMPRGTLDSTYIEGLSSDLRTKAQAMKNSADNIMRTSADTGKRTSIEQQVLETEKLQKQANKVAAKYGDSSATVERVNGEDYMFMSIPISQGDGAPFKTAFSALESATSAGRKFGVVEDEVGLFRRDPLTGGFNLLNKEERRIAILNNVEGEYLADIRSFQRYSTKGAELEEGLSRTSGLDRFLTIGGKNYTGFILDAANHFNEYISGAMNRATDLTSGTSTNLLKLVQKDFIDLKNPSKVKVWDAVNQGNSQGKYFSELELKRDFHMDDAEVNATYSVYRFWDTLWQLDNRTLARSLNNKGYHIISKDDTVLFGKPYKVPKGEHKFAYDLSTQSKVRIDDTNEFAYTLKQPLEIDGVSYKRVVGDLSSHSRLVRESDSVLARKEGYVRRIYKDDYIVEKITMRNGKEHREAVAAGDSMSSARSWIEKQKSGDEYRTRRARELTSNDVVTDGYERSRSVEKVRGEHLKGIERTESELADVNNPVDAMVQAAITTANGAVMFDSIKTLKGTFMKNYGLHKFPVAENSAELRNITKNGKDVTGEAKALWSYITKMESKANAGIISEVYRDVLLNVSEILDGSGKASALAGMTAKQLRVLAKVDPIQAMKTLPHLLFIAAAPIRQLVLQHSQLIQLSALTKRYANPLSLVKDIHAIRALTSVADDVAQFDKTVKALSKTLKRSETDVRNLFKSWKESGLAESIDSHQFVEQNLALVGKEAYNTAGQAFAERAKSVFTVIPKYGQKYGFDIGETNNLIGSFLVAAERKKGKVDLGTTAGRAEIADDARKLSWNFNNAGKMDYQYGALSLPMMYAQVPHKAMLNLLAGSGTLTRAERAKVFAVNFSLFGATAFGIDSLLDGFGDDLSPEARSLMKDGLVNITLNSLLNGLTDSNGNSIDFSGNLSATSGYLEYTASLFDMVVEGKISLGGAPFAAMKKVGDVISTSSAILTTPTIAGEGMNEEQKAVALLRNILTVYSGVNHLETALYQYKLGTLTSLNGTSAGRATGAEIIAKLFGFRTLEEANIYDLMKDSRKFHKDIEELAQSRIDTVYKASARLYAFNSWADVDQGVRLELSAVADFLETLPPEARPYAQKYIKYNIANRMDDGSSATSNIVQAAVKYMAAGGNPMELNHIKAKLGDIAAQQPDNASQATIIGDFNSIDMPTGEE